MIIAKSTEVLQFRRKIFIQLVSPVFGMEPGSVGLHLELLSLEFLRNTEVSNREYDDECDGASALGSQKRRRTRTFLKLEEHLAT